MDFASLSPMGFASLNLPQGEREEKKQNFFVKQSCGFILIPPLVFDPEGSDPKGGRSVWMLRNGRGRPLSTRGPKNRLEITKLMR